MMPSGQYIPQVDNYNAVEAFVRRMYDPTGELAQQISINPFSYRVLFENMAPGDAPTLPINIAANTDFVMLSPRYRAATVTDVDAIPLVRVLMADTGSQMRVMAEAMDITTMFGQIGKAPYEFMYPRVISGRSGVSVQAINYSDILTTPITYKSLEIVLAGIEVRGFRATSRT